MRLLEYVLVVVFWLLLGVMFISSDSHAQEPDPRLYDRGSVEAAVLHIVTQGLPRHQIKPNAGNQVLRDPAWRTELAAAIALAGARHGVPVWFLIAVAYREGSFRRAPVGEIGETSTFQITPRTARHFKCDMTTTAGQADCSAQIIRHHWDKCGTLGGGFMRYATGRRICSPDTERLLWMRWDRLGIAEALRRRFER
jgi:hypothetical protein